MPEKLSFEESLRRLEQIAQTLESGQAGLDESMELYAQAAKLIAFCQKKLDNAQLKMEKLASSTTTDISAKKQDNGSTVQ